MMPKLSKAWKSFLHMPQSTKLSNFIQYLRYEKGQHSLTQLVQLSNKVQIIWSHTQVCTLPSNRPTETIFILHPHFFEISLQQNSWSFNRIHLQMFYNFLCPADMRMCMCTLMCVCVAVGWSPSDFSFFCEYAYGCVLLDLCSLLFVACTKMCFSLSQP